MFLCSMALYRIAIDCYSSRICVWWNEILANTTHHTVRLIGLFERERLHLHVVRIENVGVHKGRSSL